MMVVEDDYVFVEVEDDDISFIEMEEVDGMGTIFRPHQSGLNTTNNFAKSSNQTLLSMAESSSILVSDDEDTIMTDEHLKIPAFDEREGNVMEIDEAASVVTNPVLPAEPTLKPPKSLCSAASTSSTSMRRLSKKKLRREARKQKKEEKKKKREEKERKKKEKAEATVLLLDQTKVRLEKLGKVERRLGRM